MNLNTDLDMSLDVRPIYKLYQSIIKTSGMIYELNPYN